MVNPRLILKMPKYWKLNKLSNEPKLNISYLRIFLEFNAKKEYFINSNSIKIFLYSFFTPSIFNPIYFFYLIKF